jgi:PaaA2-like antitoxin
MQVRKGLKAKSAVTKIARPARAGHRGAGRPPGATRAYIRLGMAEDLLAAVDAEAAKMGQSRAAWINMAVYQALVSGFAIGGARNSRHDEWFRAKVQEALDDPRPDVPDEEVSADFVKRRASLVRARRG